jgi:phage terminase large subunit-like protein
MYTRSEFFQEWVQFPRGKNDDALDCVEIAVRNLLGAADAAPPGVGTIMPY